MVVVGGADLLTGKLRSSIKETVACHGKCDDLEGIHGLLSLMKVEVKGKEDVLPQPPGEDEGGEGGHQPIVKE